MPRVRPRKAPSLERRATVVPAPYVAAPTQQFEGDDGQWSTFTISIGTPAQSFRVLPSTSGSETWVPVIDGCEAEDDPSNCPSLRGANPFNGRASPGFELNQTSTWKQIGLYSLDLEANLGYTGNGEYGYDTVALGAPQDASKLSLNQSIVAGIADKSYFMGVFGLGIRPLSFSSSAPNTQSFLEVAKNTSKIPSLSYGYTAGAVYQEKQVSGNLVLGGYDASRFEPSDLSFSFSGTDARELQVGVQSIVAENTPTGTLSFTQATDGFLTVIDSTVPYLFLPNQTCDAMAKALGLTLDAQTDLYIINDTMHTQLQSLNPTFTFKLGNTAFDDGNNTNIVLPYAAFDLQASWPIYQEKTNYFPIRRSQNSTQYTLGRAFLQQAYLIVDHERQNFTVNQATFASTMPAPSIVAIKSIDDHSSPSSDSSSPSTSSKSSSGISGGAIAGVVIAILAVLVLAGIGAFFLLRRRRKSQRLATELADTQIHQMLATEHNGYYKVADPSNQPMELDGHPQFAEMGTPTGTLTMMKRPGTPVTPAAEMDARPIYPGPIYQGSVYTSASELETPPVRFEMEGDTVYGPMVKDGPLEQLAPVARRR